MLVSQRGLKTKISALLKNDEIDRILKEINGHAPQKLLNALFAGICNSDPKIRWNAIIAMGVTVARLADQDMEAARIVIRRFMWSLNDESGGIGWGAPEAMAQCLINHPALAEEYTNILVSFMREDGFYLELPVMHRGLLWGIGEMAKVRPELLHKWRAAKYLMPYLNSEDVVVQALAGRALALLGHQEAAAGIKKLADDRTTFDLYENGQLRVTSVAMVAAAALAALAGADN
ncbi:MAG: HEAT repeat domain-containing protein [Desulfobulbaceae bacterium]|nr:HEAT repeat domain-containing protein [Desulfobulbaceae bacterium]HIJ78399.1 HEAT repeat domain-containing protein [Deltaproteobacteria bacterium]